MKLQTALRILILVLATPLLASAAPFTITSTLLGDGRVNPDGINVDVTISGDTDSEFTSWIVDLDMAGVHDSAHLKEFYINLLGDPEDYDVFGFNPASWSLTDGDGGDAPASGSWDYMLQISGPTNTVTNSINLTFTVEKLTGDFSLADFFGAEIECSNDPLLGCGQLGAHVGGLGPGGGGSGFALGNYGGGTVTITAVPEPMSLTLLGSGLVALAARARRRRK